MVSVPVATPVTIPDVAPTVATEAEPEDHVPPEAVQAKVVVLPEQRVLSPVMAPAVPEESNVLWEICQISQLVNTLFQTPMSSMLPIQL